MPVFERNALRIAEEAAVLEVKNAVEGALQVAFSNNGSPHAGTFAGKLSTDPGSVSREITPQILMGKCGIISSELQDRLEETRRMPVNMKVSDHPKATSGHKYLTTEINGVEVIIDASIGQYIRGHTHVFVGTRSQLKKLILASRGNIINTQADLMQNPEEFFTRTWGRGVGTVSRIGTFSK